MATSSQKTAVALAFLAGLVSLVAALIAYQKSGQLHVTPIAGGLFMLALGISGIVRLRKRL